MPKLSKDTAANVTDMGPAGVGRWTELGGYRGEIVTVAQDTDLTPLLKGLPNDQCQCPHLGYVFAGRIWFRTDDGEESVTAGEAFYFGAGHTSGADAGTEFVIFSPSDKVAELEAHMMARAQELQSA